MTPAPAAGGINDVTQYKMPCTETYMGVVHPLKGKEAPTL